MVQSPWVNERNPNVWWATLILFGTGSVRVMVTAKPSEDKNGNTGDTLKNSHIINMWNN